MLENISRLLSGPPWIKIRGLVCFKCRDTQREHWRERILWKSPLGLVQPQLMWFPCRDSLRRYINTHTGPCHWHTYAPQLSLNPWDTQTEFKAHIFFFPLQNSELLFICEQGYTRGVNEKNWDGWGWAAPSAPHFLVEHSDGVYFWQVFSCSC